MTDPAEGNGGLAVSHLSVKLGGRPIVADVSFAAQPGEHVVLMGPNGAGKTSLLRAIAGLIDRSGAVSVGGRDLALGSRRERARIVSYLPQEHAIHWPISVADMVALGRLPHSGARLSLSEADRVAVDAAIEAVDIGHLRARTATRLSGGELARAALARALAVEAPVLLADEPTAALDPRYRLVMMDLLRATARAGRVVVSVVHDLTLAARYADRVLVVSQGALVGDGPPEKVLNDNLLKEVFAIEVQRGERDGMPYIVPWRPFGPLGH